jgi:hypothetical protein
MNFKKTPPKSIKNSDFLVAVICKAIDDQADFDTHFSYAVLKLTVIYPRTIAIAQ